MSRTFTRLFAVVLVLAMLFGVAGVAQACEIPGQTAVQAKHGNGNGNGKHYSYMFGDTTLEDYPWAFKHIEKMAAMGIITGLGNGIFNGNASIKHEDAVIMIVRYMGLETEALAAMNATLPFADANSVDFWARGYVKVALDHNLLWVPDAGQLTRFDPRAATSRLEAVVMLVKAAGLEDEAKARMGEKLTFKDAASIPTGFIGYVAVAVENGIAAGYDDNTFQPFRAVKRAEMATFIGRADENIPRKAHDNEVSGKVVATTANTITVSCQGCQETFTLVANCPVYLDDEIAELADLAPGDFVEVELDSQDRAVFIDATSGTGGNDGAPVVLTGTVHAITIPASGAASIEVTLTNHTTKTFTLATNCVIKINGTAADVEDIEVGDSVQLTTVTGHADQLAQILITRDEDADSVAGVVKGLTIGNPSRITVLPDDHTTNESYSLASNCVIKVNGHTSSLLKAEIVVGDRVEMKLTGELVTEIDVIREEAKTVEGVVKAISIHSGSGSVITIREAGHASDTSYLLASDVVVTYDDEDVELSDIQVGDDVTLTVTNPSGTPLVTKILIASRATSASGTVTGINYDARTITVTKSGTATTYDVSSAVVVKLLGQTSTWSKVSLNDVVTLTLEDDTVTKIEITVHYADYTGTVKSISIDPNGNHFVATISGTDRTVDVPDDATITHDGAAAEFSDIDIGATVVITGSFDGTKIIADEIEIQ